MEQITWQDFEKIEIRVGTITKVEDFPEAKKPAYKIWANFGEAGTKKSSAQITRLYKKEDLIGKQIIGILNFKPKQIGNFISEFLTTGFVTENDAVVLAVPEKKVASGLKLT